MKKFVVSCHQQSWLESKLKEAGQRFISQDPRPMISMGYNEWTENKNRYQYIIQIYLPCQHRYVMNDLWAIPAIHIQINAAFGIH